MRVKPLRLWPPHHQGPPRALSSHERERDVRKTIGGDYLDCFNLRKIDLLLIATDLLITVTSFKNVFLFIDAFIYQTVEKL